jgi:hypothetical protein
MPVPELFRPEQIVTQTGTGVALTRVVVEVGQDWVDVSTPSAPDWGIQRFGRHAADNHSGLLNELLPPNAGVLHRRPAPRTNRALVRALGTILAAQRLSAAGVTVTSTQHLDGSLLDADVFTPPLLAHYTFELVREYLPYDGMVVELKRPSVRYEGRRWISVRPE